MGTLFTVVGLVSLLIPAIPFICIGALIFGPIELMIGLFGNAPSRRPAGMPPAPVDEVTRPTPMAFCASCGMKNDRTMSYCTNCGARLV